MVFHIHTLSPRTQGSKITPVLLSLFNNSKPTQKADILSSFRQNESKLKKISQKKLGGVVKSAMMKSTKLQEEDTKAISLFLEKLSEEPTICHHELLINFI